MSPWLIVILMIGVVVAIWWVLIGNRKNKEMFGR